MTIYAFEGISGAGKSTLIREFRRRTGLPEFEDRGRHGVLSSFDSPRDWLVRGAQHDLDLATLSRSSDFVSDRWILSSRVYDRARRTTLSDEKTREILAISDAVVFVVRCDPETAHERLLRRDGAAKRSVEELASDARWMEIEAEFVASEIGGSRVRFVDGSGSLEVAVRESTRGFARSAPPGCATGLVARARRYGARVRSAFGETRELLGVSLVVEVDDLRPWEGEHLEFEAIVAELPRLERVLRDDPGSRRAVAYVGRLRETGEEDFCLPLVQFLVRDGEVDAFCYARSSDLAAKLPDDLRVLAQATRLLAEKLGFYCGKIHFFAASGHVYEL